LVTGGRPATIDEWIAGYPAEVQPIRQTITSAAPDVQEVIS
jgi:hypothetical protein